MTWAYVCGIIVCIIFSHIFSSAEMSYSSCNRMRLENARDDGSKRAKVAVKIVDNFDDSLSAILIGNNLANIANSSDRKSTRLNSSHYQQSRMPSSA